MKVRKGVLFGQEKPVICVPVVEKSETAILERMEELTACGVPMIEWRMDWYEDVVDLSKVEALLKQMAGRMQHTVLLCTYRSKQQGGEGTLDEAFCEELNLAVSGSGTADLVDLEFCRAKDPGRQIQRLQESGIWVVCSHHVFEKTPAREEMEQTLIKMLEAGADFAKLAVMPGKRSDVLALMEAVLRVKEQQPQGHLIAMSMGADGIISRLLGGWYGSEVTFASYGKSSAPGQVPYKEAELLLKELSGYC